MHQNTNYADMTVYVLVETGIYLLREELISLKKTAQAIAALSAFTFPGRGMEATKSEFSLTRRETPKPSDPMIRQILPL